MEANGRVDLSLAKPGDQCHCRNGKVRIFKGETSPTHMNARSFPYCADGEGLLDLTFLRDGQYDGWGEDGNDILRVTRNGVQITPAVELEKQYLNAGPGCDLGRYRTGEVPQVGDKVKAHEEKVGGSGPAPYLSEAIVLHVADLGDGDVRVYFEANDRSGHYAARFDLISRATPAVPSEPEEPVCKTCNGKRRVEYMTIMGERETDCPECVTYADSKPKGSVLCGKQDSAKTLEEIAPTTAELMAWTEPKPVITGPGIYRTEGYDDKGGKHLLANVHGKINEFWYGSVGLKDILYRWNDDGECDSPGTVISITGPYVPPPEPVLTHAQWLRERVEQWFSAGPDAIDGMIGNDRTRILQIARELEAEAGKAVG